MNFSRRFAFVAVLALAVIGLAIWLIVRAANPLPQTYRNCTYGFALRLPADYAVTEAPNTNPAQENGTADIIEFADKAGAVQMTITYASYVSPELTVQSLLANYPSLSSVQTQPFPIAPRNTGLAVDDDSAQPNQVSDVWFAQDGYLYQLTASGDGFTELLPIAHSLTLL